MNTNANTQPLRPLGYIVRQSKGGYAAKFHDNLIGPQITWTDDDHATQFGSAGEGSQMAVAYGLRLADFCVVAMWPVEKVKVA